MDRKILEGERKKKMKIERIRIMKNGELKMMLPKATVKDDNTVWTTAGQPIINSDKIAESGVAHSDVEAWMKNREYDKIPGSLFITFGDNGNGLVVVDDEKYIADRRKQRNDAMTDAQRERSEINRLFAQAEKRIEDEDDDNVSDHYRLLAEAKARLAAWQEKYPEAHKAEQKKALVSKADHCRELASEALGFDADGMLDKTARQKRHDEFIAQAEKLEAEAETL